MVTAVADTKKKLGFPGFIPPGANPQQTAAALAARPMPNVLAGTGFGMGDPMKQLAPIAPAVGGGLAPAFGSGLTGENARYNALPQDNAQNAGMAAVANVPAAALTNRPLVAAATPAPVVPAQPASAGVGGIPTGGPAGWTGGATKPAPQAAFGDFQTKIQNQVERAVFGAPVTQKPVANTPAAAKTVPQQATYSNEGRNYPAGGNVQSPAVTTAPTTAKGLAFGEASALGTFGNGYTDMGGGIAGKGATKNRTDGGPNGVANNFTNIGVDGEPTAMSGQDTRTPDQIANGERLKAETAKVVAASGGLANLQRDNAIMAANIRDGIDPYRGTSKSPGPQFFIPEQTQAQKMADITSPEFRAARSQNMEMQQKLGESPAAYQIRMQAMAESQRLAQAQASGEADFGLRRDTLAANTKQADARLALDQQRLGNDGQRLGLDALRLNNELATGEMAKLEKGLAMEDAKAMRDLRTKYMAAPEAEKGAIAEQMRVLAGKPREQDWKVQVTPTTKNADGSTSAGSVVRYNSATGRVEVVDGIGGAGSGAAATGGQKYTVSQTVKNDEGQKARVLAIDANGTPTLQRL